MPRTKSLPKQLSRERLSALNSNATHHPHDGVESGVALTSAAAAGTTAGTTAAGAAPSQKNLSGADTEQKSAGTGLFTALLMGGMTVAKLKVALSDKGLSTSGRKPELAERLAASEAADLATQEALCQLERLRVEKYDTPRTAAKHLPAAAEAAAAAARAPGMRRRWPLAADWASLPEEILVTIIKLALSHKADYGIVLATEGTHYGNRAEAVRS